MAPALTRTRRSTSSTSSALRRSAPTASSRLVSAENRYRGLPGQTPLEFIRSVGSAGEY